MSLITTNEDAALLDAGRMATELAQRYRFSIEHLIQGSQQRQMLEQRIDQLEATAGQLAGIARQTGLLPREPNLEMSELRTLADTLSSWLDDAASSRLLTRFADDERSLLEELETARMTGQNQRNAVLDQARQQATEFIEHLPSH